VGVRLRFVSGVALAASLGGFAVTGSPAAAAGEPVIFAVEQVNGAGDVAAIPVEPGATAMLRVHVRSGGAGLTIPDAPDEGVRVCTRPGRVDRPAEWNCVGWLRAGDRNDAAVEVALDLPLDTPAGAYTNYDVIALNAAGQTVQTAGLPPIQVKSALADSEVDTYRLFEDQRAVGVYWVGSNKRGKQYTSPQGALVTFGTVSGDYQGGWVFQRVGAAGAVTELRQFPDTTGVIYVNRARNGSGVATDGGPAAPALAGVPTGTVTATTAAITTTVPANHELFTQVNGGRWVRQSSGTISLAGLPNGTVTLEAQLVNGSGLPGAITTATWTVDDGSGRPPFTGPVTPPAPGATGYLLAAEDGQVSSFGAATPLERSSTTSHGSEPIVDIVYNPFRTGYWTLDRSGTVVSYGEARVLPGDGGNVARDGWRGGETAVALSSSPTGAGYWVFTSAGRVLRFGDAGPLADLLAVPLQKPVVDAAIAPSGSGVYLVAEDGGVFSLGDAISYGALPAALGGNLPNLPVRSILPQPGGYLLVAEDGGVFSFGSTQFLGSLPGIPVTPNRPIASIVTAGAGYLLVGEDGGVFAFGTEFRGSLGATGSASRIVGIASI
jgi:hypothetical protein